MGQRSSSQKKATETSTAKLSDFLPSNTCKDLKSKTLHTTSKPSLNLSQKIQLVLSLRSKNSSTHDPIKGENKLPLLRKKGVSLTDVNSRLFSNNFTPFKEDDRKIKRNTNMKFINISPNNLNKMKKEKNRLSMLKIMGISSNSDFDSKNLSLRSNRNSIIKRSFFGSKSKIVKSEDSSPIKEKEKPNLLKIITNKHIIDHLKQKEDQNKNEIKENNNASNDEKNIKKEEETNIFKSPLIKAFKIDKISTSSILTANYNEHMNRKKENQQKNHDVIKKKKAMKQFLNIQQEKKVNMNTFEFEISSLRKSDDTLLNINDHKELMDYFRRSKIRNDLFSNKSNHTPMIKVKNIGFDKEKTTSTKKIIGTTFNQIEELEYKHKKNHSEFAFPSFTQTFHSFDEHEKKNTLFDKNKEKFSINTKILLYPNNRSNLQAKIEEQKSQQIKPYENLSSVRTIINMAQLKPVKLQKKKKNLIFFKNKVIQIENNELNNDSNKTQHLEKESLFHKIIRSGESPTNFFLTSKKKIAN